jgi:preprotein translocase subunit SecG
MYTIVLLAHFMLCFVLLVLILVQRGKGAQSALGMGASATVFGASGSDNFITRLTSWVAFAFFISTLLLGAVQEDHRNSQSVQAVAQTVNQPVDKHK